MFIITDSVNGHYFTRQKMWLYPIYERGHKTYPGAHKFRNQTTAQNMVRRLVEADKKQAKKMKIAYRKIKVVYSVHKLKQITVTATLDVIEE